MGRTKTKRNTTSSKTPQAKEGNTTPKPTEQEVEQLLNEETYGETYATQSVEEAPKKKGYGSTSSKGKGNFPDDGDSEPDELIPSRQNNGKRKSTKYRQEQGGTGDSDPGDDDDDDGDGSDDSGDGGSYHDGLINPSLCRGQACNQDPSHFLTPRETDYARKFMVSYYAKIPSLAFWHNIRDSIHRFLHKALLSRRCKPSEQLIKSYLAGEAEIPSDVDLLLRLFLNELPPFIEDIEDSSFVNHLKTNNAVISGVDFLQAIDQYVVLNDRVYRHMYTKMLYAQRIDALAPGLQETLLQYEDIARLVHRGSFVHSQKTLVDNLMGLLYTDVSPQLMCSWNDSYTTRVGTAAHYNLHSYILYIIGHVRLYKADNVLPAPGTSSALAHSALADRPSPSKPSRIELKFCKLHGRVRHSTEECRVLQDRAKARREAQAKQQAAQDSRATASSSSSSPPAAPAASPPALAHSAMALATTWNEDLPDQST